MITGKSEVLPKVIKSGKKRLGRGYGSGKGGHTSGRGMKGQKSRKKVPVLFEGLKLKKSLLRRLPLRRGKMKFQSRPKPIIVKARYLNLFNDGEKVDVDGLVRVGIVAKSDVDTYGVKILGDGKVEKKLTVCVPISGSAARQIKAAGGKIE